MKKTVSLFLSLLFLLFTFVSCGDETPKVEYKDDVPVIHLCKNTLAAITLENSKAELTEISSKVLDINFGDVKDQNLCDQFTVFHTSGVSFDEIGIFHVKGKAEDQLYRSYFPGEEYKLDKAEVRTFRNYAVFAILSDKNRSAFFAEIERLLKK